ncbi:MAG: hypothetical protein HQL60_07455, partial [Magnetococcales bacterium]|nr:hypothetical protein [Magnetococcales bacterium]
YTSAQLEQIRKTLQGSLGDAGAAQAIANLEQRFTPSENSVQQTDSNQKKPGHAGPKPVDIGEVLASDSIEKILETLPLVKEDHEIRPVVEALIKHPETKAFHLVDALSNVSKNVTFVEMLVEAIVTKKGINPLIDALKYASLSSKSVTMLANSIGEQGTVTHVLRAIASAPPNQPEAEIVWAMEVIGKGGFEQINDALKLMDINSPGIVVLTTGLVNRPGVAIEHLIRPLAVIKENSQALTVLLTRLAKLVDVPQMLSLLEKHIPDNCEGAEYVAARLVNRCLASASRVKEIAMACRCMRTDSMTARILAYGVVKQGAEDQMMRAYERLPAGSTAKHMAGIGVLNKVNKLKALTLLGREGMALSKYAGEVQAAMRAAQERYQWIMANIMGEPVATS